MSQSEALKKTSGYAESQIRLLLAELKNSSHNVKLKAIKKFQDYISNYKPDVALTVQRDVQTHRPTTWEDVIFRPVPLQEGEKGDQEEGDMVDIITPIPDPLGLVDIDLRELQSSISQGKLQIAKILGHKMTRTRSRVRTMTLLDITRVSSDNDLYDDSSDNDEEDEPVLDRRRSSVYNKRMTMIRKPTQIAEDLNLTLAAQVSVIPRDKTFSSGLFLRLVHPDISPTDMKLGQLNLKKQLDLQRNQRESLIRSHYSLFIQCVEGIDWLKDYRKGVVKPLDNSSELFGVRKREIFIPKPTKSNQNGLINLKKAIKNLSISKSESERTLAPIFASTHSIERWIRYSKLLREIESEDSYKEYMRISYVKQYNYLIDVLTYITCQFKQCAIDNYQTPVNKIINWYNGLYSGRFREDSRNIQPENKNDNSVIEILVNENIDSLISFISSILETSTTSYKDNQLAKEIGVSEFDQLALSSVLIRLNHISSIIKCLEAWIPAIYRILIDLTTQSTSSNSSVLFVNSFAARYNQMSVLNRGGLQPTKIFSKCLSVCSDVIKQVITGYVNIPGGGIVDILIKNHLDFPVDKSIDFSDSLIDPKLDSNKIVIKIEKPLDLKDNPLGLKVLSSASYSTLLPDLIHMIIVRDVRDLLESFESLISSTDIAQSKGGAAMNWLSSNSIYFESLSTLRDISKEGELLIANYILDKMIEGIPVSYNELSSSNYTNDTRPLGQERAVKVFEDGIINCLNTLKSVLKRPDWVSSVVVDGCVKACEQFVDLISQQKDDIFQVLSSSNAQTKSLSSQYSDLKILDTDLQLSNGSEPSSSSVYDYLIALVYLRSNTIPNVFNRVISEFPNYSPSNNKNDVTIKLNPTLASQQTIILKEFAQLIDQKIKKFSFGQLVVPVIREIFQIETAIITSLTSQLKSLVRRVLYISYDILAKNELSSSASANMLTLPTHLAKAILLISTSKNEARRALNRISMSAGDLNIVSRNVDGDANSKSNANSDDLYSTYITKQYFHILVNSYDDLIQSLTNNSIPLSSTSTSSVRIPLTLSQAIEESRFTSQIMKQLYPTEFSGVTNKRVDKQKSKELISEELQREWNKYCSSQNDLKRGINPNSIISQVLSQSTGINSNGFSFNLFRGHMSNHPIELDNDNIMLQQLIHGIGIGAGIINHVNDPKEFINESNMNRVITMLQNHIKQWSFIESQLLEPNVNLAMPEIIIPLKHLITALEILSKIFFNQGDMLNAKSSLESVCPLIELVMNYPSASMSMSSFILRDHSRDSSIEYSEECFDMLRQSYIDLRKTEGHRKKSLHSKKSSSLNEDDYDDVIYSPDFDIEQHINNLRAPYDHLRDSSHSTKITKSKRDKLYFDQSTLDLSLLLRNDLPLLLFEDHGSVRQLDLEDIGLGVGVEVSFGDLKLSQDVLTLIKRFVHENDIGREVVISETIDMMEWLKQELHAENLPDEMVRFQMEIGVIIVSIMRQVVKHGFSHINNEIYSLRGQEDSSDDLWSSLKYHKDQTRLFVLEAFDQIIEGSIIGGSDESDDDNDLNKRQHAKPPESRREKRKRLEKLIDINTPLESPETIGILSSETSDISVALSMNLSYHRYQILSNRLARLKSNQSNCRKSPNSTIVKSTIRFWRTTFAVAMSYIWGLDSDINSNSSALSKKQPLKERDKDPKYIAKTKSLPNRPTSDRNLNNWSVIMSDRYVSIVSGLLQLVQINKTRTQQSPQHLLNESAESDKSQSSISSLKSDDTITDVYKVNSISFDNNLTDKDFNNISDDDNDNDSVEEELLVASTHKLVSITTSQMSNSVSLSLNYSDDLRGQSKDIFESFDNVDEGEWIPAHKQSNTLNKKQSSANSSKPSIATTTTSKTPIKTLKTQPISTGSSKKEKTLDSKISSIDTKSLTSQLRLSTRGNGVSRPAVNISASSSPVIRANDKTSSLQSSRNVSSDQLYLGPWNKPQFTDISSTASPIITAITPKKLPVESVYESPTSSSKVPEMSLSSIKLTDPLPNRNQLPAVQSIAEDDTMRIDLISLITPPISANTTTALKDDDYEYFTSNTAADSAALILSDPITESLYLPDVDKIDVYSPVNLTSYSSENYSMSPNTNRQIFTQSIYSSNSSNYNYNYNSESQSNYQTYALMNHTIGYSSTSNYDSSDYLTTNQSNSLLLSTQLNGNNKSENNYIEDIISHNRMFGLSASAPTFTPSYVKNNSIYREDDSIKTIEQDFSNYLSEDLRPRVRTVVLTCVLRVDPVSRVHGVKIVSPAYGTWDILSSRSLIRSTSNTRLWQLTIELPDVSTKLVYKYIVQDTEGGLWEDCAGIKTIDLLKLNEIEDTVVKVQLMNK
eukprot:gene17254-22785_t